MIRLVVILLACLTALSAVADPAVLGPVNRLRVEQRLPPLRYAPRLEAAALGHAIDMAERRYFAHEGRDGSTLGDRVSAQGYRWCFAAENIAKGQKSLSEVIQSWADSPGHYANMIRREVSEIGVARGPGHIWVMVLAAPC